MDRTFYSLFIAVWPFLYHGDVSLESRPEWRRNNSEDSRMYDPFCKVQQFPTNSAITLFLPGIWQFILILFSLHPILFLYLVFSLKIISKMSSFVTSETYHILSHFLGAPFRNYPPWCVMQCNVTSVYAPLDSRMRAAIAKTGYIHIALSSFMILLLSNRRQERNKINTFFGIFTIQLSNLRDQ